MKKRLLLVTHGYPFGESERGFLAEEAKQLASRFDLVIMALDNQDQLIYPVDGVRRIERYRYSSFRKTRAYRALPRVFEPASLQEAWAFARRNGFTNPIGNLRHILYFRFNVWEMEQQIGELVESERIDIVYTFWCNECTVAAVKLKKRFPHLKVVTRFHGMDLYEERTYERWQPFRKEVARRADGLCFACEYGQSYFQERWGAKFADRMGIWYLGSTDRGVVEPSVDGVLRIISCSNVIPLKRVDLIIKGLALLPDTVQVQWHHFGDGVSREELEALAAEKFQNKTNIRWKFHGFVPNTRLTEEYRKIRPNLFITTSSTEGGAPVSVQEAFSMGIPAVGTQTGGIPDLVRDGQTGFLLPSRPEPSEVAEGIMKYVALPTDRKWEMAAAARKLWKEKFDASANAVNFAAYLENLSSTYEAWKYDQKSN